MSKRTNRTVNELLVDAHLRYGARHEDSPPGDVRWVAQIIEEAKANPLKSEDLQAEWKRLSAYGERQAKKLGIKVSDVVRLIHESRAQRKA